MYAQLVTMSVRLTPVWFFYWSLLTIRCVLVMMYRSIFISIYHSLPRSWCKPRAQPADVFDRCVHTQREIARERKNERIRKREKAGERKSRREKKKET